MGNPNINPFRSMINLRSYIISFVFLVLCVYFAGCSTGVGSTSLDNAIRRIGDGGFLSENSCGSPCFLGIIPGVSNTEDVLAVLESYDVLDLCEIEDRVIKCMRSGQAYTFWFFFNDQKMVTEIVVGPVLQIMIGDIVEKYGDPSSIEVFSLVPFSNSAETTVRMFYDDLFFSIYMPMYETYIYLLQPTSTIEFLNICQRETYEGHCVVSREYEYDVEWQGFGEYHDPKFLLQGWSPTP